MHGVGSLLLELLPSCFLTGLAEGTTTELLGCTTPSGGAVSGTELMRFREMTPISLHAASEWRMGSLRWGLACSERQIIPKGLCKRATPPQRIKGKLHCLFREQIRAVVPSDHGQLHGILLR